MTNYAAPAQNGHSCAFNANGDKIIVAGKKEGIYLADLNISEIRKHRARTIWGNAYRRPHKYDLLLSNEVDSVFLRTNDVGKKFVRTKR
jgi:predicted amidohydrolase